MIGGLMIVAALAVAGCGTGDDNSGGGIGSGSGSGSESESESQSGATSSSTSSLNVEVSPVEVFYSVGDGSDCGAVQSFDRPTGNAGVPYLDAFQQLVSGPTDIEAAAGAGSFFSSATADLVQSVVLNDGLLTVDFVDLRSLIPNASSSCGSEALLAQLNSTAFQFEPVERTRYRIEGSCDDFASWLQRECFDTDRSGQQLDVATNGRALAAGCTPSSADTLSAGRWFGFVSDAQTDELSFDLACWFTGRAAVDAASEDGEESPPPNDYYVRNDSDRIRSLPVDSATEVNWLTEPGDPASLEVVPYAVWLAGRATQTQLGVWLTVTDDGHIVQIEEQYVP